MNSGAIQRVESKEFASWNAFLVSTAGEFNRSTGALFSPSRLESLELQKSRAKSHVSVESESFGGWSVEEFEDAEISAIMESLPNDAESISAFLRRELGNFGKNGKGKAVHKFWYILMEGVLRKLGIADTARIVSEMYVDDCFSGWKYKRQMLKHLLFLHIFSLKLRLREYCSEGMLNSLLEGISNDPCVGQLRQVYEEIAVLDLKRPKERDFMQEEVLPYALRDIPFVFLKKLTLLAFDIDLFPEDAAKLWHHPLNVHIPESFRTRNPYHKWSDIILKSSADANGQTGNVFSSNDNPSASSDAIAIPEYEAPWTMHTLNAAGARNKKTANVALPRKLPTATTRMVKMEGLKQPYKRKDVKDFASTDDGLSNSVLCIYSNQENSILDFGNDPSTDEGFSIKRNSLDSMRDWDYPTHGHQNGKPAASSNMLANANDIFDDLFSPTPAPTSAPASNPTTAIKRKLTPAPPLEHEDTENRCPPNRLNNDHRECNDNLSPPNRVNSIRELLLDSPASEVKRRRATPCTIEKRTNPPMRAEHQSARAQRKAFRDNERNEYDNLNIF